MKNPTWPYDPSSPLTPLPRGHDDVEWSAVYGSDDDMADVEMTDAFDVGAFLRDMRQSEQDAANRWAYKDEAPFYPTEEDDEPRREPDQTSYDRWRDAIMDTTPPFEY